MTKHPMQPVELIKGVVRFKENAIISHLIDKGSISLNDLCFLDFSDSDWMQLHQLIGYSVSGYGGLNQTSKKSTRKADKRVSKLIRTAKETGKVEV